jgi:hypothetical protein
MIIKKFSILRFPHAARISNFHIFLADFSPDFKHVVLSFLDELLVLPYMVGKLDMYSFQPNLNRNEILFIASYMS